MNNFEFLKNYLNLQYGIMYSNLIDLKDTKIGFKTKFTAVGYTKF